VVVAYLGVFLKVAVVRFQFPREQEELRRGGVSKVLLQQIG
jgi:hypothetical protein